MRINLVPPIQLTDQHLRAEHLEITLVGDALRRTLASAKGFVASKVPSRFTLNAGHAYFFYDKGLYLNKRYVALAKEIRRRGHLARVVFPRHEWPDHLYNDWTPEPDDLTLIRVRIAERVMQKPEWYRFERKPLTDHQIAVYAWYVANYQTTFLNKEQRTEEYFDLTSSTFRSGT